MRIIIQRVSEASVSINDLVVGSIGQGFLLLLGIVEDDGPEDIDWLVGKVTRMRIFADAEDSNFWNGVQLEHIEAAIFAMDDIEAKLIAVRALRARGFAGPIVSHALYTDHVEHITQAGANETYLAMHEAGRSLAAHAIEALAPKK